MTELNDFIHSHRGVLIAPAGHGKTTAIADCLLQCPNGVCQLVLTHTHAGIASLRKKFRAKNVPTSRYELETITGFAQRYVLAFMGKSALPDEDDKHYFNQAVFKCKDLLCSRLVQSVITNTYGGIFVDEYQDCTITQHEMIMLLAKELPLHILGDPLQGIFSFDHQQLVDFNRDLSFFNQYVFLKTPWRWHNTNPCLGTAIFNMRQQLLQGEEVTLCANTNALIFVEQYSKTHGNYDIDYNRWLRGVINKHDSDSLLIICPSYRDISKYGQERLRGDLSDRISLKSIFDFSNRFRVIDAIDSSEYYSVAKAIDKYIEQILTNRKIKRLDRLIDILDSMHITKTSVDKWIKGNHIISKKSKNAERGKELEQLFQAFETQTNIETLFHVIDYVMELPGIKCRHKEVFYAIKSCVEIVRNNGVSVFDAMKIYKSRIRHQGRFVDGRCIGTTLLTKGLEFDTVIVMDAHKFSDAKNFYVAISRASKRLVFITDSPKVSFK